MKVSTENLENCRIALNVEAEASELDKSQELEPIAEPELEVTQTEPLIFKAIVSLRPEVKLGDYHDVKLEASPQAEVTDKAVAAAMEELRQRQGAWAPADRRAELRGLVTMDSRAGAG